MDLTKGSCSDQEEEEEGRKEGERRPLGQVHNMSLKSLYIRRLTSKTGLFYTVLEKRVANLHFFSRKWPNMTYNLYEKEQKEQKKKKKK